MDHKDVVELACRADWDRVTARKRFRTLVGDDAPHVKQALKEVYCRLRAVYNFYRCGGPRKRA